jgi:DNA-directed RNA polymerase specialized sigma subunit
MRLGRKRRKTMGDVARLKDGRPDYEDEASLETILYEASNTTRVDRLEISRILGACFSRLSSFSQHFLDRLYGQGETVTDLAVQMNMTRYKVTLLKNQILSRLRTCLGEHGVGDEALSP